MPLKPKKIVWEPTAMLKHPDSIKSSDYSHFKPIEPSYLKEEPNMRQLLSMDYARQWVAEKIHYEQSLKPRTDTEYLERRYAIRGLNKKKEKVDTTCHLQEKTIKNISLAKKKCH